MSLGQGQQLCFLGSWVQADMGGRGGLGGPRTSRVISRQRLIAYDNQKKKNQRWKGPLSSAGGGKRGEVYVRSVA